MINNFEQQRKRGFLIASTGSSVSIVAFFVLPFVTLTLTTSPVSSYPNTNQNVSESISAGTGLISLLTGVIWIAALLAIGALIAAAAGAFRTPSPENSVVIPTQLRNIVYTTILLSLAGIVFQFLFVSIGNSQLSGLLQSTTINTSTGSVTLADLISRNTNISLSMSYAIGSWLYLIGLCVAIVGGILVLRTGVVPVAAMQPAAQMQSWPVPNQYQSQTLQPPQVQQPWQQPSGPQQPWQQPSGPQQPWQQPSGPQQPWQQPPR